jgi:hypothetical protein
VLSHETLGAEGESRLRALLSRRDFGSRVLAEAQFHRATLLDYLGQERGRLLRLLTKHPSEFVRQTIWPEGSIARSTTTIERRALQTVWQARSRTLASLRKHFISYIESEEYLIINRGGEVYR